MRAALSSLCMLLVTALLLGGALSVTGCDRDGPAEQVGEKIDDAAEKARDTVDPPKGPLEKAGRKIDRAVND
jgi:hypothetical protein